MNYFNSGDKVYTVGDIDRLESENAELKAKIAELQNGVLAQSIADLTRKNAEL